MNDLSEVATLRRANEHLRNRLAEAEETITQLREQMVVVEPLPAWLPHLTGREEELLRMLMRGTLVTQDGYRCSFGLDDLSSDIRVALAQYIFRLRRKLEPLGIEIVNHWGRGFQMPKASIDRLTAPMVPPDVVVAGRGALGHRR